MSDIFITHDSCIGIILILSLTTMYFFAKSVARRLPKRRSKDE